MDKVTYQVVSPLDARIAPVLHRTEAAAIKRARQLNGHDGVSVVMTVVSGSSKTQTTVWPYISDCVQA